MARRKREAAHKYILVLHTSPWAIGAPMDGRNTDMAKVMEEETMQSQEKDSSFINSRISGDSSNKNMAMCSQIHIYFVCFQTVDKKW